MENNTPQSAWETVAPNVAQDDRTTNVTGFYTLQNQEEVTEDTTHEVSHDNTRNTRGTLCLLYAKAAKRQDMNFQDYCTNIGNLNTEQHHIVMYNRAWCKLHKCSKTWRKPRGNRLFLSGPGGTGKSHVVHLIQRDMSHFFKHTVKPDDDQLIAIITAPTGSAAFQIGGSTIHSALLLHDNYKSKPVGQCPIYMSPQAVHTLNDMAPNGWEKMQLHELTQSMRQKDMKFVNCLNKICTTVPLEGSKEDRMLQNCELKMNPNDEKYPSDAVHIYA